MGEQLFLEGKTEASKAIFQNLLKEDSTNVDASINLGIVYESQGNLLSAEVMYLDALDIDESNSIALNNLAILYFRIAGKDFGGFNEIHQRTVLGGTGSVIQKRETISIDLH